MDGRWFKFDDDTFTEVNSSVAIEGNFGGDAFAYALFYVRQD